MTPKRDDGLVGPEPPSAGRIRALALALIVRDGTLLVSEGYDSVKAT